MQASAKVNQDDGILGPSELLRCPHGERQEEEAMLLAALAAGLIEREAIASNTYVCVLHGRWTDTMCSKNDSLSPQFLVLRDFNQMVVSCRRNL